VLVGSAYSLDQLQAIPMGFLALQRWFGTHSQYANNIIRSALRLSIGYGSSTMRIHTSDGQVFDNVNYRFMPVSIASILDYIVPGLPIASFGLQLGAGELFAAQSGGATSLTNNAENAAFWEFGPYFRLHFTKNAFLKISYLNRKLFSNDSNVKIQRDNYSLFVGTGL